MTSDRIWLVSAIVCFVTAIATLVGCSIGMSDTLVRIFGVINVISLVIVVYRTIKNTR